VPDGGDVERAAAATAADREHDPSIAMIRHTVSSMSAMLLNSIALTARAVKPRSW
jgi:hypothetical protein